MEAVLIQTMEDVSQRLVQQREFATALESFQQKLLQDLESTKIQGQSHLTRLMKNVGSATENLVTRITSVTSIFEVNLGKLADVMFLPCPVNMNSLICLRRSFKRPTMMPSF